MVVETEVAEMVENVAEEVDVSDNEGGEGNDTSPIDSGILNQSVASELVDVVTYNEDQELRRNRPRRDVRRPVRFQV